MDKKTININLEKKTLNKLRERKKAIGVPISVQIQKAIEKDLTGGTKKN